MIKLESIKQQSLIPAFSVRKAHQACLPTCFYVLAKSYGYLPEGETLEQFVTGLDWKNNFSPKMGWLRAKTTQQLRQQYGLRVVSWQLLQKGKPGWLASRRMKAAGYFSSRREWKFYKDKVVGRSVFDLARAGHPVVVTTLPGFDNNKDVHAVILHRFKDGKIQVLDPNASNAKSAYSEEELHKSISPLGAGSIVLPK